MFGISYSEVVWFNKTIKQLKSARTWWHPQFFGTQISFKKLLLQVMKKWATIKLSWIIKKQDCKFSDVKHIQTSIPVKHMSTGIALVGVVLWLLSELSFVNSVPLLRSYLCWAHVDTQFVFTFIAKTGKAKVRNVLFLCIFFLMYASFVFVASNGFTNKFLIFPIQLFLRFCSARKRFTFSDLFFFCWHSQQ